jgi:NAD(P)-dependent dehydrogenase (short-subunit alcohol dehydrogenase family)
MDQHNQMDWTSENISDLTGKVIIVTGANSGVGYEAVKQFARKGAQSVLACRNIDKAEAARSQILDDNPDALMEIMKLDLASLKSIEQFAEQFKAKHDRLDVLVNNAGVMMVPYGTTEDGFEKQFGTNHLGHFALTGLLIDLIEKTDGSRIVNVSSNAHNFGEMDFDNLMYAEGKDYSRQGAYGRSKLANLLFTYELQRRLDAAGSNTIVVAAHPGLSDTNLANHLIDRWYLKFLRPVFGWMVQSAAMGALPTLRAAVELNVSGGEYFGPGGAREAKGYPVLVQMSDAAQNGPNAQRLWIESEKLTGVTY